MKRKMLYWGSLLCCMFLLFVSCSDENDENADLPVGKGVLILNQGLWRQNNAGISFLSSETGKLYYDIAAQKLGDNAQSMFIFGDKLFVAVSGSARITVFDLYSKNMLANIPLSGSGNAVRQPRYFATDGSKLYVSTFDGYAICLDPSSYTIEKTVQVGPNPEGIAVANGKIYVANSDGDNYLGGYANGKTVSVIDIASFSVDKTIPVGINPTFLQADNYGDIYLISNGDYSTPAAFQRIDTSTGNVSIISTVHASNFTISGNYCYFYNVTYDAEYNPLPATIGVFNVLTEELVTNNFISDGTSIGTPYGIGVNPQTGEVYISDTDYSNPGKIYVFSSEGKLSSSFLGGTNACCFAFYY